MCRIGQHDSPPKSQVALVEVFGGKVVELAIC